VIGVDLCEGDVADGGDEGGAGGGGDFLDLDGAGDGEVLALGGHALVGHGADADAAGGVGEVVGGELVDAGLDGTTLSSPGSMAERRNQFLEPMEPGTLQRWALRAARSPASAVSIIGHAPPSSPPAGSVEVQATTRSRRGRKARIVVRVFKVRASS
jgi:hypothetical protein